MSPSREEKAVEASRLSFPLPMVAAIVGTALTVASANYISQAGLRSDVRDILTRMEFQSKLDEAEKKSRDMQSESTQDAINEMKRRLELVQIQYQQLRETMLQGKSR